LLGIFAVWKVGHQERTGIEANPVNGQDIPGLGNVLPDFEQVYAGI
jgi:hypothetical protein